MRVSLVRPLQTSLGFACLAWVCSVSPARAAPAYVATPLLTVTGRSAEGTGINAKGDISGTTWRGSGSTIRAFLYRDGAFGELGTLGGDESQGLGVNNLGHVTGISATTAGLRHAFLYKDGALLDLGDLGKGFDVTAGYGINDNDEVTGNASPSDFIYSAGAAFLYRRSQMQRLEAFNVGTALNNSGDIAGYSASHLMPTRPWVIRGGVPQRIGDLDSEGMAMAIAGNGDVAGVFGNEAFLWRNGDLRALGTLSNVGGSIGRGINNRGEVVGRSYVVNTPHAFLYSGGAMYDLNSLVVAGLDGALLGEARAINDAGQIVANACPPQASADCRAFRLDPIAGAAVAQAIEFHHAGLDHYFVTHVPAEIAKLDAGVGAPGWVRTGKGFSVRVDAPLGTSPVCRFYLPPGAGDSHFYGRGTAECAQTLAAHPTFIREDPAFFNVVLPIEGTCAAAWVPVYRVFSNRPDANHRYMTDRVIRDQMVAAGWVAEGDGPDRVVMCAPA